MTILELMITVAIMSVVQLMFTSASMEIYRSVNKNEALAAAQDGINQTFSKLDEEIRYTNRASARRASRARTSTWNT